MGNKTFNRLDEVGFLQAPEYKFLKEDKNLGDNIILLGYGGSYSYGTNVPESDKDVRGIALNTVDSLIGLHGSEQRIDDETDTTVYTFDKAVTLLANCNPNMVEMLGLREEHYFVLTEIGRQLIENQDMFYSKRAINSFGGYATAQLRRLQNALAHDAYPQEEKNRHILGSLENAMATFNDRYQKTDGVFVRLNEKNELVTDMSLSGYPLVDARGMLSEMKAVIREYDKLNHRNRKKDDAHLNKHAMHLIRLLVTGTELLSTGKVVTYRENEHDLLMSIRNGKFQNKDHTFCSEFFDLVDMYEKQFKYAADNSVLPDKPDMNRLNDFVKDVNYQTVLKGYKTFPRNN